MKTNTKLIISALFLCVMSFIAGVSTGKMTSFHGKNIKAAFEQGYLLGMEEVVEQLIRKGKPQYKDIEVLSNDYLNAVKK